MRYIILRSPNPEHLAAQVQSFIDQGWRPKGGIAFAYINAPIFMQTMIKEGA